MSVRGNDRTVDCVTSCSDILHTFPRYLLVSLIPLHLPVLEQEGFNGKWGEFVHVTFFFLSTGHSPLARDRIIDYVTKWIVCDRSVWNYESHEKLFAHETSHEKLFAHQISHDKLFAWNITWKVTYMKYHMKSYLHEISHEKLFTWDITWKVICMKHHMKSYLHETSHEVTIFAWNITWKVSCMKYHMKSYLHMKHHMSSYVFAWNVTWKVICTWYITWKAICTWYITWKVICTGTRKDYVERRWVILIRVSESEAKCPTP